MPVIWELKCCCSLLISALIRPLQHIEGTGVEMTLRNIPVKATEISNCSYLKLLTTSHSPPRAQLFFFQLWNLFWCTFFVSVQSATYKCFLAHVLCAIQKSVYVKICPQYTGFASAMAFINSYNFSVVSMIKIMLNVLHDTTVISYWCHAPLDPT